jgi:sigma-B regulation protein RsbU (phosphoserine phosphatase)
VASAADVGGDWYDAFRLPDGRLAIAVGDVTGHDLRAATIMGQVRNAVRAYALLDPHPGTVLAQTNMLLWQLPDLDLVTMLYGVYDPDTHVLAWARGGHPPPLLYRAGAPAESLDEPSGRLLGASAAMDYPVGRHELAPGETLLWYTDGLIEHPDHNLRRYLDLLCERPAVPAPELVADLTGKVIPGIGQGDDICLLALSRV